MNEVSVDQHVDLIAQELGIRPVQVRATADLLADGGTVPFVSRYRKEATGSLDEVQVEAIRERLARLAEFDKRRAAILKSLTERELLSDELGARIAGASRIIVSDPVSERREVAKQFGATDLLDPGSDDVVARAREITEVGVDYAFETAGSAALAEAGFQAVRNGGTVVCVGAAPIDQSITITPAVLLTISEKKLMGCVLGSVNSLREIPRLIALWRAGRLDLESLITARRPLAEINEAMDDLRASRGVRTVLTI